MCANLTQSLRQLHFKLLNHACRELRTVTEEVNRMDREVNLRSAALLSSLGDAGEPKTSASQTRTSNGSSAAAGDGGSEPEYEDGDDEEEMVSEEVSDLLYTILSELVLSSTAPYVADFLERETASRDALINAKLARDVASGCFDGLNAKEEAALAGADFSAAAQALSAMDDGASWRAKLAALLHCKDEIFLVLEQRAVASGTDCFLPVFMYTLARAKLRAPMAACALLRQLCPPQMMKGEAGFFCTTFEAAVNYMEMIAIEEAEREAEEHSDGDEDDAGTSEVNTDEAAGEDAGSDTADKLSCNASPTSAAAEPSEPCAPDDADVIEPGDASALAADAASASSEVQTVRANYAFEARRPGDLSFAEHAVIEVRPALLEGASDRIPYFCCCSHASRFLACSAVALSFSLDLQVLSKGDNGWWSGRVVGFAEEGTFPANYCS